MSKRIVEVTYRFLVDDDSDVDVDEKDLCKDAYQVVSIIDPDEPWGMVEDPHDIEVCDGVGTGLEFSLLRIDAWVSFPFDDPEGGVDRAYEQFDTDEGGKSLWFKRSQKD